MERDKPSEASDESAVPAEAERDALVVNAHVLFDGRREICLELDGVRYRLRITRRNKLILQK
jgi:hemin uptake protein HemP